MKSFFQKIKYYWLKLSHVLGIINSTIIFGILFYIFFGLYSISLKIKKRFFRKNTRITQTYWKEKKQKEPTLELLKKQYE